MPEEPPPDAVEPLRGSIGSSPAELPVEVVDAELVGEDGLPVLVEAHEVDPAARHGLPAVLERPAVQAAAAAATGFLAGAATLALLRRGDARRLARQARDLTELRDRLGGPARPGVGPTLVPGRTYLVQFRVLGAQPPGASRPPE